MSLWYAIRTATRREKFVTKSLADKGYVVFCPHETYIRQTSLSRDICSRPLFPGYMFILFDGSDEERQRIKTFEGVHAFVTCTAHEGGVDVLFPFPTKVILGLQAEERAGVYDRTHAKPKPPYKPRKGDKVKVTAGVYIGFVARVLKTLKSERIHVMVELPGGKKTGRTIERKHLAAAE